VRRKKFEVGIGATFQVAKYIQESLWLVLEYLKKNIFSKKLGVLIKPGAKQKNWW
jgi:pyruvate/oxaloacetate carboxyltransferase